MDRKIELLAISGSLRKSSYNTAAIMAMKELVPDSVNFHVFTKMKEIPLYNPDLESKMANAVKDLKICIKNADGLIIATPEYAHGISGVLKNALDWLVSGDEFPNKPIALINTSPRASHAQDALREVLKTMSGNIVESASIAIPLLGSNLNTRSILENDGLFSILRQSIYKFSIAIQQIQNEQE